MPSPIFEKALKMQLGELLTEDPSDVEIELVGEYAWPGNVAGDAIRVSASDPADSAVSDNERMWFVLQPSDGSMKIMLDATVTQGKLRVYPLLDAEPAGNLYLYQLKSIFRARPDVLIAKINKEQVEQEQAKANDINNEGIFTGLSRSVQDIGEGVGKFAKGMAILGGVLVGVWIAINVAVKK